MIARPRRPRPPRDKAGHVFHAGLRPLHVHLRQQLEPQLQAIRHVSADASYVSYIGDATPENASPTHQKPLVSYMDDRSKPTLDNRRYVRVSGTAGPLAALW